MSDQPMTIPSRPGVEWVSFLGAVLLVVGSFMAWAQVGPFKVAGTDGDGWITAALGLAAAVQSWKRRWLWAAVPAAGGVVLAIWKLSDLSSLADEGDMFQVQPGVGLYLCLIGAGASALASVIAWSQTP